MQIVKVLNDLILEQGGDYFAEQDKADLLNDGQALLDETDIFHNLCTIGCHPRLDYLSRVVITSLAFHDNGFMSKHLIRRQIPLMSEFKETR